MQATSNTIFQLVAIDLGNGKPPATLLRMSPSPARVCLVMRQVHSALVPDVSLDQFRLTASKQHAKAIKALQGPDCWWIFKFGATSRHSHTVNIISLHTAIMACKVHDVHPIALAGLENLKSPGSYTILQSPDEMLALNCTPAVNPPGILVPLPLPSTLPKSPVNGLPRKQRYALPMVKPQLASSLVITQQLTEFHTWCTSPIQLNRQGPALQSRSWDNVLGNIWLFLGFCWKWMGVQQPSLQQFLNPHLVASFISFHMAMKHSSNTIKQHVSTALKVLAWWSTKPGGHDIGLQKMREQWLPTLSMQVRLVAMQAPLARHVHLIV